MINGGTLGKTIKFFEDEIYQYNIELGGILRDSYREYLESKKRIMSLRQKQFDN